MQNLMQQQMSEGFVITSPMPYNVRQLIENCGCLRGSTALGWKGGAEVGHWDDKPIVRADPRRFRPTEVETLLGDLAKAKENSPGYRKSSLDEIIQESWRPTWRIPKSMYCLDSTATKLP